MRPVWRSLARCAVPKQEAWCDGVFRSGQCFGWRRLASGAWVGVMGKRVVCMRNEEDGGELRYWCAAGDEAGLGTDMERFLRTEVKLAPLYAVWGKADARAASIAGCLPGMRVLRSVRPRRESPSPAPAHARRRAACRARRGPSARRRRRAR